MHRYLFALVFLGLCLLPLGAARAGEDPFTVSNIKVDATASSASEAFNIAVDGGRRNAWDRLVHRLTRQQDWARVPAVDDVTLQRMIRGYQVADEKRSTTRYVAAVTYTFNSEMVRRFLRGANIAYADSAAKPLLVIPLAPAYAPGSKWTAAWAAARTAAGGVPLVLPGGDPLDSSALTPIRFDTAEWSDVEPLASRFRAAHAALVLAKPPASGRMVLKIRILSSGPAQNLPDVDVPIPPGTQPQKGYGDAALAAAAAIGDAWKSRTAIDFNQRSTLTAEVRLDSLALWGAIQQKLAAVPIVTNINVAAMNIGQARIVISYAGTPAQLDDFLSQAALDLTNRGGAWWLSAKAADGGMVSP